MNYGIELLHIDIGLLVAKGYVLKNMTGPGDPTYYEVGTDDEDEWNAWRAALDAAKRPYKYIEGINGEAAPVNEPQW
jgi:hypothetical protein